MLGPIFLREWLTIPRRASHYVVRSAYLGLLWILGWTAWQATVGWGQTATLGDNARFGLLLFKICTLVQLVLLPFFAAVSAANAITHEKDRRTFVLLLITDLRAYEIVLGKLLGSFLQIFLLLLSTAPVLALIMLLGGVAPSQVVQALLVLAVFSLAAGSVGCLMALWREKTFQALALTVLSLVLYLCIVQALPVLPALTGGWPWRDPAAAQRAVTTAQQWLGPFQALETVFEPQAHLADAVPPAYGFAGVMVLISVLLNAWGMVKLRVWNPSGEPIMQREQPEDAEEKDRLKAHAAPGKAREVWPNPVLWREMNTRAYGRRPLLVKVAYLVVLGLVCYYALAPVVASGGQAAPPLDPGYTLALVGILSLLLVSAQAVTAITSERDLGSLDLLLVTDLSPQEFIFGKLWGIIYNTKEFLLPPIILALVYAWYGYLARPPANHPELRGYRNAEAVVCLVATIVILLAFAMVLGMHVALRTSKSRMAVLNTLATVFSLSVGTGVCIGLIRINTRFEVQWLSFSIFLFAGILGMWWVLRADRPSAAINIAATWCPLAVFYTVTNILVGRPGSPQSADPLIPFLMTGGAFAFAVAAMLVPLLSEFDVALGRTSAPGE